MRDAIIVQNLGKCFSRYHAKKPVTIMEAALSGWRKMKPVERFWALRHVNFTVAQGEMLGVLGHNGAGKSTLLQLIGGVGCPSEGKVRTNGRIGALLDLGAGFHSDLTGRENLFISAIAAGLTRRDVGKIFDDIVEFAELEAFIDNPVRTYSTGMVMRLAFSVAIHTQPDVLLVDEFLSVGDLSFQGKCLDRIETLRNEGCAIVLISHSPDQIQRLCDRALWLKMGRVVAQGTPEVVVGQYVAEMRSNTRDRTPNSSSKMTKTGIELRVNENRFGSLEAEILDINLLPRSFIKSGDPLTVEIEYLCHQKIDRPIFNISITREDGQVCLDTNTDSQKTAIAEMKGQGKIRLHLERLDLQGGKYYVNAGIYAADWSYAYDYHWHVYPLSVDTVNHGYGLLSPPSRWEAIGTTVPSLK